MKLSLKTSKTHWVKIGDAEFYLSPISVEQYENLQDMQYDDDVGLYGRGLKIARYYIKYAIKDWKGIQDQDGNEIKCIVRNNELDDELWWALVNDEQTAIEIYNEVLKEVGWTDNDKKKLSLLQSFNEKISSQAQEETIQ